MHVWSIDGLVMLDEACSHGVNVHPIASTIPATVPFYALSIATFASDVSFFEFEFDQDIPISRILGVWEHAMGCDDDGQILLHPNMQWKEDVVDFSKFLVLVTNKCVKLLLNA